MVRSQWLLYNRKYLQPFGLFCEGCVFNCSRKWSVTSQPKLQLKLVRFEHGGKQRIMCPQKQEMCPQNIRAYRVMPFICKMKGPQTQCLRAFWRSRWDSNPRALADKRFSRPPRYDHFDTAPGICYSVVQRTRTKVLGTHWGHITSFAAIMKSANALIYWFFINKSNEGQLVVKTASLWPLRYSSINCALL